MCKASDKSKTLVSILFFVIGVLIFYMLYKQPLRLDDLSWGGSIGVERYSNFFAGYNGRYLGNLAVLLLTRVPALVRTVIEEVIVALLVVSYYLLKKDKISTALYFILLFTMPLKIVAQSVTWISGFSNYFISALFVLLIVYVDFEETENPTVKPKYLPLRAVEYCIVVFLGQLVIETATIYTVVLSVIVFIWYSVKNKKLSVMLTSQLLGSIAGAVAIFSNTSYYSAYVHDGTNHKAISIGDSSFTGLVDNVIRFYRETIAQMWFGNNLLLNIILSVIVIVICFRLRKTIGYVFGTIGVFFAGCFIYDDLNGDRMVEYSDLWMYFLSITYTVFILLVILLLVKDVTSRNRLLIMMFSTIFLMLPTLVATPIHDRCFFNTFIFWALITAEFARLLFKDLKPLDINSLYIVALANVLIISMLINYTIGQIPAWQLEDIRMNQIEKCKSDNLPVLVIPRIPWSNIFCYGADLNDEYWFDNYKEFYEVDPSVTLIFLGYSEYMIWDQIVEDNDGELPVGFRMFNDKWYYFSNDGELCTGYRKLSGHWYYFLEDGQMYCGWLIDSGDRYYFDNNGVMVTGWNKISNEWYYFEDNGAMLADTSMTDGDRTYYFDPDGICTNP